MGDPTRGNTFKKHVPRQSRARSCSRQAWEALLALDGWEVTTRLMSLDLAYGIRSIFSDIAPSSQEDVTVKWHGREVTGRVYMRDLLDIAKRGALLTSINSSETGLDYAVYISSTPAVGQLPALVKSKKDPRVALLVTG